MDQLEEEDAAASLAAQRESEPFRFLCEHRSAVPVCPYLSDLLLELSGLCCPHSRLGASDEEPLAADVVLQDAYKRTAEMDQAPPVPLKRLSSSVSTEQ